MSSQLPPKPALPTVSPLQSLYRHLPGFSGCKSRSSPVLPSPEPHIQFISKATLSSGASPHLTGPFLSRIYSPHSTHRLVFKHRTCHVTALPENLSVPSHEIPTPCRGPQGLLEASVSVLISSCSLRMMRRLFLFQEHPHGCSCLGAFARLFPLHTSLFPRSWLSCFLSWCHLLPSLTTLSRGASSLVL